MSHRELLKKDLYKAMKNYRGAVKWFRETIAYKNSVVGNEWAEDGKWLIDDSDYAYKEVINDIKKYRNEINSIKLQLQT